MCLARRFRCSYTPKNELHAVVQAPVHPFFPVSPVQCCVLRPVGLGPAHQSTLASTSRTRLCPFSTNLMNFRSFFEKLFCSKKFLNKNHLHFAMVFGPEKMFFRHKQVPGNFLQRLRKFTNTQYMQCCMPHAVLRDVVYAVMYDIAVFSCIC